MDFRTCFACTTQQAVQRKPAHCVRLLAETVSTPPLQFDMVDQDKQNIRQHSILQDKFLHTSTAQHSKFHSSKPLQFCQFGTSPDNTLQDSCLSERTWPSSHYHNNISRQKLAELAALTYPPCTTSMTQGCCARWIMLLNCRYMCAKWADLAAILSSPIRTE